MQGEPRTRDVVVDVCVTFDASVRGPVAKDRDAYAGPMNIDAPSRSWHLYGHADFSNYASGSSDERQNHERDRGDQPNIPG